MYLFSHFDTCHHLALPIHVPSGQGAPGPVAYSRRLGGENPNPHQYRRLVLMRFKGVLNHNEDVHIVAVGEHKAVTAYVRAELHPHSSPVMNVASS